MQMTGLPSICPPCDLDIWPHMIISCGHNKESFIAVYSTGVIEQKLPFIKMLLLLLGGKKKENAFLHTMSHLELS